MLAAGSGTRFGGRKQFTAVNGRRLVDRAVETASSICESVVVVLPPDVTWDGPPVTASTVGGATRSDSVRSGLAAIPWSTEIVVIHDPAHPLATRRLMEDVIEAVRAGADAALPVISLVDPLKQVQGGRVIRTVPRDEIVMAQSPQAFRADALRAAHEREPDAIEDTMLIEAMGGTIVTVPGDPWNLHVVTPHDLVRAARLLDDGSQDIGVT